MDFAALLDAFLAAFEPIAAQFLGGLATWLIGLFQKYFPTNVNAKAQETVSAAERITTNVTNDPAKSMAWLKGAYANFDELENGNANYPAMAGFAQDVHARYVIMSDVQVPHAIAAGVVHIGLANGRVKAAQPKKP